MSVAPIKLYLQINHEKKKKKICSNRFEGSPTKKKVKQFFD